MLSLKLFHHLMNVIHTPWSFSHFCSWIICVTSRTVPIWENFWLKTDGKIILFCTSLQEISGRPKMISLFNSKTWPNLEFPLSREHFCISPWYFNSSIQTTFVVSICNVSSKVYISTYWAIVRSLIARETRVWPSIWSSLKIVVLL